MEIPSIFLNRILSEAVKKNASNLHITVGSVPMMRVNDRLVPMEGENMADVELIEKLIASFLSEEEMQKLKEKKEVTTVKTFAGNFRFRINVIYQKKLPSLSFRSTPGVIRGIQDLNLPKFLFNLSSLESGLFIISGSQLSGKTTTAAAVIEEINKTRSKRIITIENPIELLFINKKSIIEQRQVGTDIESIMEGVNYCLEEDVDVAYISDMGEEFEAVMPKILELAAGNSLVILEVNGENSVRVLEKIMNSLEKKMKNDSARYSLADILTAVLVQKLIPRVGGGMALAIEVLLVSSAVKSLIREGKIYQLESILQTSRKEGMMSMDKCIEELVKTGEIRDEDIKQSLLS